MLQFVNGGNFLTKEAGNSPEAVKYREKIKSWAVRYSYAAKLFNNGEDLLSKMSSLTRRPVSDFMLDSVSIRADQYNPIVAGINFGRAALFLGMGRGKTFIGGYICNYLQRYSPMAQDFPNNQFLVLCPKTVISEWADQIPGFFDCTISSYPDNPYADTDIVVTNYEQLHKLVERKDKFGGIMLDESQRAKNMGTKTFELISEFADLNTFYRFVLTGTPILNKPDDMFTQLSFINPYAFDFSHDFMKSEFFSKKWIPKAKFYKESFRAKYRPKFHRIMNSNSFILPSTSEDVDIKYHRVPCDLTGKQAKMIEHVAKGYIKLEQRINLGDMKGNQKQIELRGAIGKELQISSGFLMAGDQILRFPSPKLAKAMAILDEYPTDEQFIIWTYFRETTQRFASSIPSSAAIYGDTSDAQRKKAIADFKTGKLRVLVMQIKSGNAGLNLQMCTKQLFAEYDWTPANIEQAIARSARSGQNDTVTIWLLYTTGTADEFVIKAVRDKKKITSAIMATYITKQLHKARAGSIRGIL